MFNESITVSHDFRSFVALKIMMNVTSYAIFYCKFWYCYTAGLVYTF